jgi:hypothetical protein
MVTENIPPLQESRQPTPDSHRGRNINLDDLFQEEPTKPRSQTTGTTLRATPRPRAEPAEAASADWPRDLHRPAKSWINKLPKPSARSLPFYEASIRTAYGCAWIDNRSEGAELRCLQSWTTYVQENAKDNPGIARRLKAVADEAAKAGRLSQGECLAHAKDIAIFGGTDACKSVGNLCLAVISADKALDQGEISLIAGIWKVLCLEAAALIRALERLMSADPRMAEAAENAGILSSMTAADKLGVLKRRYTVLNARMQTLRAGELEKARAELEQVVRATQIYKELVEHVR